MEKLKSVLLIVVMYFISYFIGLCSFYIKTNFLFQLFLFDFFATIVIFIFSIFVKNSSLYDPYWSVTPLVMSVICIIKYQNFSILHVLLFVCLLVWSCRLTINWYVTFKDLKHEDWRYISYRNRFNPILFQVVNFFGIQLMPTILVFLGFTPFIILSSFETLNWFMIFGFLLMLFGTNLEFISDRNMHSFLKENHNFEVCQNGLWNYSRHPNYLGEILFWFGLFIALFINNVQMYYYGIGSLLIFILFEFISIPLMEKRQIQRREKYQEYCESTSRLLLLPKKH